MFNYNKKNYILIIFLCLISAYIHFYPSTKSNYPVGFDTYRLHTIRINYIINDGTKILGDLVSPDFLNPMRYQWGFHLILGTIGIIIGEDSLTLLRVLPFFLSFLFPLSIYIASPFFGVNDRKTRLLATMISPFTLSNPVIHGLIYPFPSSMGIILFTIGLRIIYEAKNSKTWKLLLILLIPTYFFIYKPLGIIYIIIILTLTPSLFIPKNYKFNLYLGGKPISLKSNYESFYACLIISTIITLSLGIINFKVFSMAGLWNSPPPSYLNIPEIYKIYQVPGITQSILFLISISYIIFQSLKKKKLSKYSPGLLTFLSITILSAGSFYPTRWVLYALPIIITINGIFLAKLINTLQSKQISIIIQKLIIICIICLFASETMLQLLQIYPTYGFSHNFTNEETNIVTNIKSLQNNSIVLSDYRINRLLNAYAINKTLIYTSSGNIIHYYEIGNKDYLSMLNNDDFSILPNVGNAEFVYLVLRRSYFPEFFKNVLHSANEIFYQDSSFAIIKFYLQPININTDFFGDENDDGIIDPWNGYSKYNSSKFKMIDSETQQITVNNDVTSIGLIIKKPLNNLKINFSFAISGLSQDKKLDQCFYFSASKRVENTWYSIRYYFTNGSYCYGAENSSSQVSYIQMINNNNWYNFNSENLIQIFNDTFQIPLKDDIKLTLTMRNWNDENISIKIKEILIIKESYY